MCLHKVDESKNCSGVTNDDGSSISKDESYQDCRTAPPYVAAQTNSYNVSFFSPSTFTGTKK